MPKKESLPKEKQEFDGRIWTNILKFNTDLDAQLTSKTNFLFGAATLISLYILNKVVTQNFLSMPMLVRLGWAILLLGSFSSAVLSIMVVLPKLRIFSKKDRVAKDIFYYKNITGYYSRKEYVKYLRKLPMNNDLVCEAYSNQIYSLAKNILPFKFKMLKYSGWILQTSFLISFILFGINYAMQRNLEKMLVF